MPESEHKKPRMRPVPGETNRPSIRPRSSMTQYRVLHGPKIRRYYSIGDPVKDQTAPINLLRLLLVIGGLLGVIFAIILMIRRAG
jgi:hypothetical protein